LKKQFQVLKK